MKIYVWHRLRSIIFIDSFNRPSMTIYDKFVSHQDEQIFEHVIHAASPREYALLDSSF